VVNVDVQVNEVFIAFIITAVVEDGTILGGVDFHYDKAESD
jgi:hypothetical protein|tara:strand:- start:76 stop:198 length:123 start_codon:yes stop_codon:yes gene_type:complete